MKSSLTESAAQSVFNRTYAYQAPAKRLTTVAAIQSAALFGLVFPLGVDQMTELNVYHVLLWLNLILSSVALGVSATFRPLAYISNFAFVYNYVFLALVPFLQEAKSARTWELSFDDNLRCEAISVLIVTTIVFCLGLAIGNRVFRRVATYFPVSSIVLGTPSVALIRFLALAVFSGAGVMATGGLSLMFESRTERSTALPDVSDGLNMLMSIWPGYAIFIAFYASFAAWLYARTTTVRNPWGLGLLTFVAGIACLAINNPIAIPRFQFGLVLLAPTLLMLRTIDVRISRYLPMVFVVSLILVFPFLDSYRVSSTEAFTVDLAIAPILEKGDFDSYEMLEGAVEYTRIEGFQYGFQTASALGFIVPRSIYPSKGLATGILLGTYYNLHNTNLACPLPAEIYIDFGWPGILLVMFLLGALMAAYDSVLVRHPWSLVGLIGILFAAMQIILWRGPLMAVMPMVVFLLIGCIASDLFSLFLRILLRSGLFNR